MTTSIKTATAATSKQVCAPSRELNDDELALATGGRSAKPSATPIEYLKFSFKLVAV